MPARWRSTYRRFFIYALDVGLAALSFPIALYLRLGWENFSQNWSDFQLEWAVFMLITAAALRLFQMEKSAWRYTSIADAFNILRTALLVNLTFTAVIFMLTRLEGFPRSMILVNIFVLSAALAAPRLLYRTIATGQIRREPASSGGRAVPALLVGAGDEAEGFLREMERTRHAPYRVVGILSGGIRDATIGSRVRGIEILGMIDNLRNVVAKLARSGRQPERIIVTSLLMRGPAMRTLLEECHELGIKLSRLPRLSELRDAHGDALEVKSVDVEDLLGRPQITLDRQPVEGLLSGKRVMVTGAGGSIGSEIVRQVAALDPAKLVLFDDSEYNLYEIDQQVSYEFPALPRRALVGDVRDLQHVEEIFAQERPQIVFHAAALKHVPILEDQPNEAALTNVLGTRHIADSCCTFGVESMVMISTDKACNPTSIMGATKRIAETYCQALDVRERGRGGCSFVTVRFGNVLGSAGSVVPLFQKQLAQGGPITVTHPDMTRYFMTVREAVELVLQAAALDDARLAAGGAIVVLDMGEPVNILDMAHQMVRIAGLEPGRDIEIKIIGTRAGERFNETLFTDEEEIQPTGQKGLMIATPQFAHLASITPKVENLIEAARVRDSVLCRELIGNLSSNAALAEHRPAAASD